MSRRKPESQKLRILRAVIEFVGGREELAERLGVSKRCIDAWLYRGDVPEHQWLKLSVVSENRFNPLDFAG